MVIVGSDAIEDEQGRSGRAATGADPAGPDPSSPAGKPPGASDAKPESALGQVAAAVIGVAGAGIGGAGLVVAVGGIVTQARFRGAGLPDEQAVAVQTQGVLLDVGGRVLVSAALVALALVAAVHWSEELFKALGLENDGQPERSLSPLRKLFSKLKGLLIGLLKRFRNGAWRLFYWLIALAVVGNYFAWAVRSGLQAGMLMIMTIAALIGAAIVAVLARSAHKARAQGSRTEVVLLVGVFVSVVALAGAGAAAGNLVRPRVRATAVLLTNPPQLICGLYVGQTKDRLYIGETVASGDNRDLGDHRMGELIEVARSRVSTLLIGSSVDLTSALERAKDFRDQLMAIAAGLGVDVPAAERTISCEAPLLTHAPPKS